MLRLKITSDLHDWFNDRLVRNVEGLKKGIRDAKRKKTFAY